MNGEENSLKPFTRALRTVALWCFSTTLVSPATEGRAQEGPTLPPLTVGVLVDGEGGRFSRFEQAVHQEIRLLLAEDFRVELPAEKRIQAGGSVEAADGAIDRLLEDPEVDIVLALGPVTSHRLAGREELAKPSVAALILNTQIQGLTPDPGGGSGMSPSCPLEHPPRRRSTPLARSRVAYSCSPCPI
jgi:hypothetical protein